jgi:hypothetical protein
MPTLGTFVVQQRVIDGPFGETDTWARVVGGRVVEKGIGRPPNEADVAVVRTFGAAMYERSGELDLIESLEGGDIRGSTSSLMLLAGWYESDESIDDRRTLAGPHCGALVELARVLESEAWGRASAVLREHATPATTTP